MNDDNRSGGNPVRVTPRLIVGVAFLGAGVLLTLENFGIFDAGWAWDFWPLIFVAIGAVKLRDVQRTGAWLSGSLWVVLGVVWILYNVGAIDVHPIELWPLLLILAGFMLVSRAIGPPRRPDDTDTENRMTGMAALCGVRRQTATKDFRGGDFTAVMGGCEVDLRNAEISNGEAVIDVFALWGGVEIHVPKSFMVNSQVTALLGGYEDKTDQSEADPNQKLVVRGIAMMGGVDISN